MLNLNHVAHTYFATEARQLHPVFGCVECVRWLAYLSRVDSDEAHSHGHDHLGSFLPSLACDESRHQKLRNSRSTHMSRILLTTLFPLRKWNDGIRAPNFRSLENTTKSFYSISGLSGDGGLGQG